MFILALCSMTIPTSLLVCGFSVINFSQASTIITVPGASADVILRDKANVFKQTYTILCHVKCTYDCSCHEKYCVSITFSVNLGPNFPAYYSVNALIHELTIYIDRK